MTTKKVPLPVNQNTTHEEYMGTVVPLNLSTAIGGQAASAMNGEAPQASATIGTSAQAANSSSSGRGLSLASRFRRKKGSSSQNAAQADEQVDSAAASIVRTQVAGTGRQVKARMWLSKDSPINQKQLLPLLDIMGSTNQYISKVPGVPPRLHTQ